MNPVTILSFLTLLFFVVTSSASAQPSGNDLLAQTFKKRTSCPCAFVVADFNSGRVRGIVSYSQDESGHTNVAGIFSQGIEDQNAKYGLQIVDECHRVLFDLTDELNITPDGRTGSRSFRHKFTNFSVNCGSNGILTKTINNSKRTNECRNRSFRKRLPNGTRVTQDGQGIGYANMS